MEESDRLSTTALVVALIALVVSSLQLLQQYFSTSDGLRRCRESFLGPWSHLTRTPFHWTELRYETIYSTPEIELSNLKQLGSTEEPTYRVVRLPNSNNELALVYIERSEDDLSQQLVGILPLQAHSPLQQQSKEDATETPDAEKATLSLPVCSSVSPSRIPFFPNLSIRMKYDEHVRSAIAATFLSGNNRARSSEGMIWGMIQKVMGFHQMGLRPNPKDYVTWSPFLREMCMRTAEPTSWPLQSSEARTQSEPTIRVLEHSWDFSPGASKPRAVSTVSSIAIIAVRMGMDWDRFGGGQSGMEAFGNGCSLSSTSDPTGRVLTFACEYGCKRVPLDILPTKRSDKLICGIIRRTLGGLEIKLVADDGKLDHDRLAASLSLSSEAHDVLEKALKPRRPLLKAVADDLIVFVMPFLTVPGIDKFNIKFSGWFGEIGRHSVFQQPFYELIFQKLQEITDYFAQIDGVIKELVDGLETLRDTSEPRVKWRTLAEQHRNGKCEAFLIRVQDMHDRTTQWLKAMPFSYCTLLDAYVIRASVEIDRLNSGKAAVADQRKGPHVPPASEWPSGHYSRRHLRLLKLYTRKSFVEALKEHMRTNGDLDPPDEEVVEIAWLVLLARGMLWDMSCYCLPPGRPIPSSTYYNTTRVWIE
ncbi:hypothetical protein HII31_06744 [Pseudocercospora fuligena]|uniref:Modin n=1 Tax=Pseudocercospora fuligena TaxID=685502 RepID=A0A8H6RI58_9PEZI|nr:hypothetical protein HII31_06744 [Pseudocercospora fuligena]